MRFLLFLMMFLVAFGCAIPEGKKQDIIIHYLDTPTHENCAQPYLFANKETLFMSWIEQTNDSIASLKFAKLTDTVWSPPEQIATGSDWFVNWADFPAIAENNDNLLSHFLEKSADGTYTYDIKMKLYDAKRGVWNKDFILHNDGIQSEHGFVSIAPYRDESFFVTWLDGRNTTGGHGHHGSGAMTIRAANISATGQITDEVELDAKTCDCCQTSAAITENGPVVVYRDRSDDELRDISISRFVNGSWTTPKTIYNDNWKIEGCPVNGPKAASYKNKLAVAWYTGADELPKVKLIFSEDNGATFGIPVEIDQVETIGRVDVTFISANNALMSWVTSEKGETVVKAVKVGVDGKVGDPFVVIAFDSSRSSGFPQLEILKNKAYFAWTDVSGETPTIKTAYVPLDNL